MVLLPQGEFSEDYDFDIVQCLTSFMKHVIYLKSVRQPCNILLCTLPIKTHSNDKEFLKVKKVNNDYQIFRILVFLYGPIKMQHNLII